MRRSLLVGGSLLTALAASLCCILPLIAAAGGIAVLGASTAFEAWRPYLLFATVLLLSGGGFLAYRDYRRGCAPGSLCETKPVTKWNFLSLGLVAAVALSLALFPYYSSSVVQAMGAPKVKKESPNGNIQSSHFGISGMTCSSCARGLEASFRNMPGVREAKVDYDSKQATVTFEPSKQTDEALKNLVAEAGYKVTQKSR